MQEIERDFPRWVRLFVGKPALWNGLLWCGVGCVYLAYGLASLDPSSPNCWPFVMTGNAEFFGVFMLVVAVKDRRRNSGRYARR
ncbi:hypothetical protein [Leifsonia sp. LS-T14]|uniref:hypothetical protein n=1 Tax=unclassified Leifsonia TaxID=2663824 RepID=UPI0035A6BFFA